MSENEEAIKQSLQPGKVIEVNHLTQDFGMGMGIFDMLFDVYKGECFGFLGPNGAGKTTTIRHIMGFYKPQEGECRVNGYESFSSYHELLKDVGYLPGEPALPKYFTGQEFIDEMMALKGVKDRSTLDYLLDYFEVDPFLKCKQMSLGMKRKIAVTVAFLSDPSVLVLDEPTSGLDPAMQDKFIKFVISEKKRGKTILLSSHIFSEVDQTCDRIAIIKDGKLVSTFDADSLKHKSQKTFYIVFSDPESYERCVSSPDEKISVFDKEENSLKVGIAVDDCDVNVLISSLKDGNVASFTQKPETLKDYFMSFYHEDNEYDGLSNG